MPAPALVFPKSSQRLLGAYQGDRQVACRLDKDISRAAFTALYEDLGLPHGDKEVGGHVDRAALLALDVTTAATVDASVKTQAALLAKSAGVIAGLQAAFRVFQLIEPEVKTKALVEEGAGIQAIPQRIATIEGSARAILVAERSALNLLQRMCGIATVARRFAQKAAPFGIAILDTRKTTPGLRTLEKYAVQTGGALNHRYGLFDAVLIKDNHVRLSGGVKAAIARSRAAHPQMPVQVEVTNLDELAEALQASADKIILDNMTPQMVRQCVKLADKRSILEISGGVNYNNIDDYLIEGIAAISIGALTHSVTSMDISLEIEV